MVGLLPCRNPTQLPPTISRSVTIVHAGRSYAFPNRSTLMAAWLDLNQPLDHEFQMELQIRDIRSITNVDDLRFMAETLCRLAFHFQSVNKKLVHQLAAADAAAAPVTDRHRQMAEEILASLQQP